MATDQSSSESLRMARQHIESLRAAGVEWIGRATARHAPPAAPIDETTEARADPGRVEPVSAPVSLFDAPRAQTEPEHSTEQKLQSLKVLNEGQVVGCQRCGELARNRTQTVFGVGSPDAEVCFIGEAPGGEEDLRGEPFIGPAGQLLTRIIEACQMRREDVYIANILKCRPPGNRTPLPNEVANCFPFLEKQLSIIRPKYLVALGAVAAQALLQTTQGIGKLRGRFHDYRGIPVLCTYHPAYLLRNPAAKRDVWDDMKQLLGRMGRSVP